MAKAKNSSKRAQYVSKGVHSTVAASTRKAMRRGRAETQKMADIRTAWAKGTNPWITRENPNKAETNKRFVRIRANDLWGSPRSLAKYIIPSMRLKADA